MGRYSNQKRSFPISWTSKRKSLELSEPFDPPSYLPTFLEATKHCQYYRNEGSNNKMFRVESVESSLENITFNLRLGIKLFSSDFYEGG